ncbi:MAG: thiol:disulfide interchange protein [Halieaceae bacterium]|jgi:thiol:disulfide interchange protein
MRLFVVLLLCLQPIWSIAQAESNPFAADASSNAEAFLPVEEAYQLAVDVIDPTTLRVYWQIAPDYYLYQSRFKWQLSDAEGEIAVEPSFPVGVSHEDEYFGEQEVYYFNADISLTLARASESLLFVATSQGCADAGLCYPPQREYFRVNTVNGTIARTTRAEVNGDAAPKTGQVPDKDEAQPLTLTTLLYMIVLAFAGGTILNLMPCVFPILSLKVLSFAGGEDHNKHVHGWVYSAGVVVSFVLIASVLIGLKEAGQAVGWGFQLQSPIFITALAYLFFAMGLSLSGLVHFGGSLMGVGNDLANQKGYSGSFFTGVLATVVASPCTAPFMGTALGFAITQPPQVGLLVFAALGAGMAAPMLLLSYSRRFRELMPKPGPWMELLKQALAFPLYATVVWLLWVAGRQTGVDGMAMALIGCLALALALWLWSASLWRRAWALACLALAAMVMLNLPTRAASLDVDTNTGAYSQERLLGLRESGQVVFLNVTADWCITCIANERATLSQPEIKALLNSDQVTYLKADWTNYDPTIAALLEDYDRTGIPLYLAFPADPSKPALILPQILTPGIVREAINSL